ncbi:uncharacterized protein LOC143635604 [Bidens hawaiensis]|uniref:uncharacterized protein LOC143635604 n=1 Tax=Bidens hawaiensis TaxID=980011 RepID=UPI00404A0531
MGRKGKEPVGSSSNPADQPKRRRLIFQRDDPESEEEEEQIREKPIWRSGSLADQPQEWQAELFHDQMNALRQRTDAFICEKEVREEEFGPFGVTAKFRELGWEAALKCYDKESTHLFNSEIQEWMATLRQVTGNHPSKHKLIGTVNGVQVEMSFDSLRRVAKFDSKPHNQYKFPDLDDLYFAPEKYPMWNTMLDDMFFPGTYAGKLYWRNLKMEAKLMLTISINNVIPRRGDRIEVRYPEVPILYTLLHGSPLISYRFLVTNNVWISRNSVDRKIIPHCRLITALLKKYGAIRVGDRGSYKKFNPFDISHLGSSWVYSTSERYHKLKSDRKRWRVLKENTRPLIAGEEDDPESEDELSGDEAYHDDPNVTHMNVDQGGPSGDGSQPGMQSGYVGSAFDYAQRPYDSSWAYQGTMQEVVERQRPPTFGNWPEYSQTIFDQQTFMGTSMERALKWSYDRQEQWNRTHAYAFEDDMNSRYLDDRQRRMHDVWHAG